MMFTYHPAIRRVARRVLPLWFAGSGVECPCCRRSFRRFIERHMIDRMCPGCLCLRRHRLLLLYLLRETTVTSGDLSVLHVAPEEGLGDRLHELAAARYVSVDAHPASIATHTADVVSLPFDEDTFDLAICSHVLEHVVEDRIAMAELLRVLRPGGQALLLQPIHNELPRTIEDPTITEPEDRLRAFGQRDHVRIYGRDFVPRLQEAGFEVEVVDYVEHLDPETITRYGLGPESIYVGRKPAGPSAAATPATAALTDSRR